jgi:hypothetical protein
MGNKPGTRFCSVSSCFTRSGLAPSLSTCRAKRGKFVARNEGGRC